MAGEYKVLKETQLTRVGDVGLETYFRVQIKTRGGTVLTVDIEQDDFTPEKAAPILKQAADNADNIAKL